MQKLLMAIMIIVGLVSAWFIPDLCAHEIVKVKIEYPDPVLEENYGPCLRDIPAEYNPEGKINPFMTLAQWDAIEKKANQIVIITKIPNTPLTRLSLQQYDLTSVVIGESFRMAFFTSGKGRSYKGSEGDYIGKDGAKIKSIALGIVQLTDGTVIKRNRW